MILPKIKLLGSTTAATIGILGCCYYYASSSSMMTVDAFTLPTKQTTNVFLTKPSSSLLSLHDDDHHATFSALFMTKEEKTATSTSTSTTSEKPTLKLYNSLTNTKEPFQSITPNKVSMYTCGPTVYDYAHVGNFRAFLTYDLLKRTLSYFNYDVDHICNLTDVDDKIIQKCTKENISLIELTRKYENCFMDDLRALNIIPARVYPRATEHINEMVTLIQDLERVGLAYQSLEGSWYFRVEEKEGYGQQLVKLDVKGMKKNKGTDATDNNDDDDDDLDADEYDADKVGVRDFALWKAYKPEFDRKDATWDTPIGNGRPGWHLECSAMAKKYLGDTIDIHCGGIDLKFPHHENEIAQSEGASGKKYVNTWVHNGFVNIGEEKMSKSKGNFLTLRNACPKSDDIRAYRYLVISSQYRAALSFTQEATGAAKGALKRIDNVQRMLTETLDNVKEVDVQDSGSGSDSEIVKRVEKELQNFEAALMDDLSMPRAAASLFGVIKAAETEFKRFKREQKEAEGSGDTDDDDDDDTTTTVEVKPLDLVGLTAIRNAIMQMDKIFGIFYDVPKPKGEDGKEIDDDDENDADGGEVPDEVMELVKSRTAAKDSKDWDLADSLRSRITELGFAVKDVKGGDPVVSKL